MKVPKIPETVAKCRTIDGLISIIIERTTPSASGRQFEFSTLTEFPDDEIGNALADELIENLNRGKVRL